DIAGMPAFQRLEHLAILGKIHVVGNLGAVIDVHDVDVHGVLLRLASYRISASGLIHSGAARPPRRRRWAAGRSSSATRSGARRFSTPSSPDRRSADWLPCR